MPRRKAKDALEHLGTGECAEVLQQLLKRHPDLRGEASSIAESLIDDVSVEAIADEVSGRVSAISIDRLGVRAGEHSWGYVEPSRAAWDLLEESIEGIRADMKRRHAAGNHEAAERICQGFVLGLHEVEGTNNDGALGWAPDFPAEAAAWSLSLLLELYPQRERRAAGDRIVSAVAEKADDWGEMLGRVVVEATNAKRSRRR